MEYQRCHYKVGPDQYCTPERVSNNKNNTACRLKKPFDSQYFCRDYKIWSKAYISDGKAYGQCRNQGVDKYCSDPASNQNVCPDPTTHPKLANSLLFIFLMNYVMGLVTCLRLEGRKWLPIIAALCNFYPQYGKQIVILRLKYF